MRRTLPWVAALAVIMMAVGYSWADPVRQPTRESVAGGGGAGGATPLQLDDNSCVEWGDAQDATACYDGTDLVINPQAVGAGDLALTGGGFNMDSNMLFRGDTTTDQFVVGLRSGFGRQLIIADYDTSGIESALLDFDHATPVDPTLILQSVTDPDTDNTQWGKISYGSAIDRFLFQTGGGPIVFAADLEFLNAAGPAMADTNASSSVPNILPEKSDTDTGIGHQANVLHLIAGGASRLNANVSTIEITLPIQHSLASFWDLSVDGDALLTDAAGTGAGRISMGGTSSAYPSIKRVGSIIRFLLADSDVNHAQIVSATLGVTDITGSAIFIQNNDGGINFANDAGIRSDVTRAQFLVGVDTTAGQHIVFVDKDTANVTGTPKDFDHPNGTDFKAFFNAATDPDADPTEWGSLSYSSVNDQFDIETGGGPISFAAQLEHTGADPVLSSCGTTPTVIGADSAGKITIGTGVTTSCTATFATAFGAAPSCIVVGDNTAVTFAATTTTTVLTITSSADMDSDVINYHCIGL